MSSLVLVTGPSGFLGAHVFAQLLENKAYRLRGTVRSQEKADAILKLYPGDKDRIEMQIVPDIAKPGAFANAVKGVDYIVHVASPFHFSFERWEELIEPAISGTTGILQEAAKGNTVKRVIITSSFASIISPDKGMWPEKTYTPEDWSNVTLEEAQTTTVKPTIYRASKKFAEKSAWEFVKEAKPQFDLITICPPLIWGPIIGKVDMAALNESNRQLWAAMQNKDLLPQQPVQWWVDVRDVAKAHANALSPSVKGNQRFLTSAGFWSWPKIADALRKQFPNKQFPTTPKDYELKKTFQLDSSKAEKELGIQWTTLESTLHDTFSQLYAQQ